MLLRPPWRRPALLLAALWALLCLDLQLEVAFSTPSTKHVGDWRMPGLPGLAPGLFPRSRATAARAPRRAGVQEVSANELDALVLTGEPLLLDVYAEWCGPCKLMEPILETLSTRLAPSGVRVLRMDSDTFPEKATSLEAYALPTLIFFRAGREVHRFEGAMELKELEAIARPLLGADGTQASATTARAEQPASAEELELAVQMEDALAVGFVAPWAAHSRLLESSLHLLQGRLQEAGSPARVLIVDAASMQEVLSSLGVRSLPAVLFFSGGQQVSQLAGEVSLEQLVAAAEEGFGVPLA